MTFKSSVDVLNRKMEGTEERTNEEEDRTVKITQYDQPRENILLKKTKINKQKTKQPAPTKK